MGSNVLPQAVQSQPLIYKPKWKCRKLSKKKKEPNKSTGRSTQAAPLSFENEYKCR